MRIVTAMDMRKRLGEILDAAAAGEQITIERDGHPMAVLVTPEAAARIGEDEQARIQRGLAALDRLDEFRERMDRLYPDPPDTPSAVELVRRDRDGRAEHIAQVIEEANRRARDEKT